MTTTTKTKTTADTRYTQEAIDAGVKFLKNENVNFEYDKDEDEIRFDIDVGCRIWTDGTGTWSMGAVKGVWVHGLSLMAQHSRQHYSKDDWAKLDESDLYWSGGLTGYANYDGTGKDGTWHDGVDDATALINRNTSKESDGLIYGDEGFTRHLERYLQDRCDFDNTFVKLENYLSFDYSEQGMQTEESVNFDVDMDGDFWLLCAKKAGIINDKGEAQ